MKKEFVDRYSTASDLITQKPQIAVLSIGAVEQHGRHLPLNTDMVIAEELSMSVARQLNAFLLPTIPFSMSECHGSIPGTVWIKPDTLAAVVNDIICSIRISGICQILIISGHGGNFILGPITRELNLKHPDLKIVLSPEIGSSLEYSESYFNQIEGDIHGGEIETSVQIYLNPDLVRPSRIDGIPSVGREYMDYIELSKLNPDGIWGTPSAGTAEKGYRFLTEEVAFILKFARDAFEK